MTARNKSALDEYPIFIIALSCGCEVQWQYSPPKKGEYLTCTRHGGVWVTERRKPVAA
jgi:hypothetical protein